MHMIQNRRHFLTGLMAGAAGAVVAPTTGTCGAAPRNDHRAHWEV